MPMHMVIALWTNLVKILNEEAEEEKKQQEEQEQSSSFSMPSMPDFGSFQMPSF